MFSKVDLNTRLIFMARLLRLFAYGLLSVVLVLYLTERGLETPAIGLLLSLTLFGDAVISLWLTTSADRAGRRKTLLIGAVLMIAAGLIFAITGQYWILVVTAIFGVLSPSGNEIGPFLSVEQAALTQLTPSHRRTGVFAWYNLAGSFATALGALIGGVLAQLGQNNGFTALTSYQVVIVAYSLAGILLFLLFLRLSSAIEVDIVPKMGDEILRLPILNFGLYNSRHIVLKLCGLFALDAFAGGFIVQSIMAYWFQIRFHVDPATLGAIFFGGNILAGISALLAARIAAKIGLINTMVFTHLPSNVLLMLVPLMPNFALAVIVLFLRFSISQMDVPTRQSYTMAVVQPHERAAASGVTTIARSVGAAIAPSLSGLFLAVPSLVSLPFYIAGGLKIVYDLMLYRQFKALKPPEETK